MKKKVAAITMALVLCMGLTACGNKAADQPADPAQETTDTQTDATVVTPEQAPEDVVADDTPIDVEENSKQPIDEAMTVDGDFEAFANYIKDAVKAKNIEALGTLIAFPVYVAPAGKSEEGVTVETMDDFMALGVDKVITQELMTAMEAVDTATLTKVEAGYVMMNGEEGASITFNTVDGAFGIVGIQY